MWRDDELMRRDLADLGREWHRTRSEVEEQLIGSILSRPDSVRTAVAAGIEGRCFDDPRLELIFNACAALAMLGKLKHEARWQRRFVLNLIGAAERARLCGRMNDRWLLSLFDRYPGPAAVRKLSLRLIDLISRERRAGEKIRQARQLISEAIEGRRA